MTGFQVVAISLLAIGAAFTIRAASLRRIGPVVTLIWFSLWVAAGVAIVQPEITARVARALGIARGADLVFYSAILAMFFGFFALTVRIRRLESQITTLVREIALRDAASNGDADA